MLPTPSASDGIGGGPNDPVNRIAKNHQVQLIDIGMYPASADTIWGKYRDAIANWEQLTRPAPPPTLPSARAKHGASLNPAFAEWMMGWPEGWVTDPALGISRTDQLRIIGNGVVPQQAHAAISYLAQIAAEA